MSLRHIAIAGGSLAAVTAANTLRAGGFDGRITMIADENHAPYTRPPLSKGILKGDDELSSATLHLAEGIEVHQGVRATGLRVADRRLELSDGDELAYDKLIVATGARARSLASTPDSRELRLRTLDDAREIHNAVHAGSSVAIVGAGPLGMEIASVCRELGREVTIVDPFPPMRQQVGRYLAALLEEAALDHGVTFVRAQGPVAVSTDRDRMTEIIGPDIQLGADAVITAAGDLANTEWLEGSGLTLDNGLIVDERLQAGPDVVAAGDVVARRRNRGTFRTPLWTSALDQGHHAATGLVSTTSAGYQARPYFWTEQFDISLKVCGTIPADAEPVVVAGSRADRTFVAQWIVGGTAVAAATVNHRMPATKLRRLASERLANL